MFPSRGGQNDWCTPFPGFQNCVCVCVSVRMPRPEKVCNRRDKQSAGRCMSRHGLWTHRRPPPFGRQSTAHARSYRAPPHTHIVPLLFALQLISAAGWPLHKCDGLSLPIDARECCERLSRRPHQLFAARARFVEGTLCAIICTEELSGLTQMNREQKCRIT